MANKSETIVLEVWTIYKLQTRTRTPEAWVDHTSHGSADDMIAALKLWRRQVPKKQFRALIITETAIL